MYFNLEENQVKIMKQTENPLRIIFLYENKKYYYKSIEKVEDLYNELIAEKIATKLGIPCCHYFLGCSGDTVGVISPMFSKAHYQTIGEFLKEVYHTQQVEEKNDLEDLFQAFLLKFSEEQAKELFKKLNQIFIFDALIGNCDRNTQNYGLIQTEGKVEFAPLFDNDTMLSEFGIYDGDYCLGITKEDCKGQQEQQVNLMYKYLDQGENEQELVKDMLPIISEDSIQNILKEVESDQVLIHPVVKFDIINRFKVNYHMISKYWDRKG